jgi:hypothetical protein
MDEGQRNAVGASLYYRNHVNRSHNFTIVETIDLSHFLNHILEWRQSLEKSGYVLMKLDIEGYEHTLIPNLILSKALCKVDQVFAEIHRFGRVFPEVQNYTAEDFLNFFRYFTHASEVNRSKHSSLL